MNEEEKTYTIHNRGSKIIDLNVIRETNSVKFDDKWNSLKSEKKTHQ